MLRTKDICEKLGVHWHTVHGFIRRGELKAYRLKRDYIIKEEDFQEFLEKRVVKVEVK